MTYTNPGPWLGRTQQYIRLIGCLRDIQNITIHHKNYEYNGGQFKINA